MTLDEARERRLQDPPEGDDSHERKLIDVLMATPDPAGVLTLAEALAQKHPSSAEIIQALAGLSPETDADKIEALWGALADRPDVALAGVLAKLGWPARRPPPLETVRRVLVLTNLRYRVNLVRAGAAFAGAIPPDDLAANDRLYLAWTRCQWSELIPRLSEPDRRPGPAGAISLARALRRPGHPAGKLLLQLSPTRDGAQIEALWRELADGHRPQLASVLADLGWPAPRPVPTALAHAILDLAVMYAATDVMRAVVVLARAIRPDDALLNDAIFAAWARCESRALERLIATQGRHAATPALEALYTLITGDLTRLALLQDEDGTLLAQVFAVAPEPLLSRMSRIPTPCCASSMRFEPSLPMPSLPMPSRQRQPGPRVRSTHRKAAGASCRGRPESPPEAVTAVSSEIASAADPSSDHPSRSTCGMARSWCSCRRGSSGCRSNHADPVGCCCPRIGSACTQ
ncbi:serine/threonine-protein kinase [Thiocapsa marina]|uniref:Uncharacterized protein n=1 Tax=Thiocapsa marina 5811 TaxID=768671 RepID=F9UHX0_9GAMM|nr:hypothetical protein [Thiocapsa marina]EGV16146.1 hypothetical protein ThimaDRAFT_4523 [Thiocapsa marina 5811]